MCMGCPAAAGHLGTQYLPPKDLLDPGGGGGGADP